MTTHSDSEHGTSSGDHPMDPAPPPSVPSADPPPVRHAPPTAPGRLVAPEQRSAWPVVIGIVAVVFGILGASGRALSMITVVVMQWMNSNDAPPLGDEEAGAAIGAIPDAWFNATIASYIVGGLISLLLLVGGTGLLRRRRWGVSTLKVWAVARIVSSLPEAGLAYVIQREQFATMQASGGLVMPMPMTSGLLYFTVLWTIAWAAALPIAVLVVLTMRKSREEIATWP
jgi:hypothetical protein